MRHSAGVRSRARGQQYLPVRGFRRLSPWPVVLTLQRNRSIRGHVLAATGPVIGATVGARVLEGGGSLLTARSGFDGGFELQIPEEAQRLQAIVSPPGGALKAYEVDVSHGADLLLQVEPSGGDVVVRLAAHTLRIPRPPGRGAPRRARWRRRTARATDRRRSRGRRWRCAAAVPCS